jgi:hypothetical protein
MNNKADTSPSRQRGSSLSIARMQNQQLVPAELVVANALLREIRTGLD